MSDGDAQVFTDINIDANGEVTNHIMDVNELIELIGENGEEAATSLVNVQLDILNQRNESINKLEMEYEEQLRGYTSMVHEANSELNRIERRLGSCVRTSFPYYHAMDDMMSAKENLDKFMDMFKQVQSYLLAIHDFREHFTHGRGEYEMSNVWTKVADKIDQKAIAFREKKSVLDSDIQKWTDAISSIKLTVKDVETGIQKQIRKARFVLMPKSGSDNHLSIHGNKDSMNLNSFILTNIQSSHYFKVYLYELKTYHEVIDEIYNKVRHLEPWEKGSRNTHGLKGMCGGVRGVGGGGIVSTAYCILYKLYTLKLTRKQTIGLMNHQDSPYIRALGFMYIRYTQAPQDLVSWYEDYLEDPEELDVKAGGGCTMSIGQMLCLWLTRIEWFDTLFPRIPVPIQKTIEAYLGEHINKSKSDTQCEENGLAEMNCVEESRIEPRHARRSRSHRCDSRHGRHRHSDGYNLSRHSQYGRSRSGSHRRSNRRHRHAESDEDSFERELRYAKLEKHRSHRTRHRHH